MINYISSGFKWFFKLEAASGILLLISAIVALYISNSNLSEIYFRQSINYFNNWDGLRGFTFIDFICQK